MLGADTYLRLSYMSGSTTYEIEGVDNNMSWRSRLKFPAYTMRLDAGGSIQLKRTELSFGGWTSLDRASGALTDDDWTDGVKDIWSRSDLALDAWGLYGGMTYWSVKEKNFSAGPSLGFSFDHYSFDASNVRQWGDVASQDGKVLTYEQSMFALKPGLAALWRPTKELAIGGDFSISPLAIVWDEDDHILRDKLSEGLAGAWHLSLGLNLDYLIYQFKLSRLCFGINGRYTYLESWTGQQSQEYYDGPSQGQSFDNISYSVTRNHFTVGCQLSLQF